MPQDYSLRPSAPRVYRHTVKRQLATVLTLPEIQRHGLTHPRDGYWLMLPLGFGVIAALETKAVMLVVLKVLRLTVGVPGPGLQGRQDGRCAAYRLRVTLARQTRYGLPPPGRQGRRPDESGFGRQAGASRSCEL